MLGADFVLAFRAAQPGDEEAFATRWRDVDPALPWHLNVRDRL